MEGGEEQGARKYEALAVLRGCQEQEEAPAIMSNESGKVVTARLPTDFR